MLNRILNIAWKDFLHLWHNKILLVIVLLGGATELTLVGMATGAPIDDVRTVIYDADGSQISRELIARFEADETFAVTVADEPLPDDLNEIFTGALFGDDYIVAIDIPEGFGEELRAGRKPEVTIHLNAISALAATTARRKAEEILFYYGAEVAWPDVSRDELEAFEPQITVRYNEELDRAQYTTPSEAGFMLYVIAIGVAAFMLAREREFGSFEQLLVMPHHPMEILTGKAIPAVVLGYANFLLLLGVIHFIFGVPIRGSLPLLLVLALFYVLVELGVGFLLALISHTQHQAVLLVMLVAFVDIAFSGYAAPVESMPPAMQTISLAFPIRHFLIILRGVLQKGVGLEILWPHVLALAALGLLINGAALLLFRRSLASER